MSDATPVEPVETVETVEPVETAQPKPPIGWLPLTIAALFGLVYAYLVWLAIGNAINFPTFFEATGHADDVPWTLFVVAIIVPVAFYVLAFVASIRRGVLAQVVAFIVGLGASAALGYSLSGLVIYVFRSLGA